MSTRQLLSSKTAGRIQAVGYCLLMLIAAGCKPAAQNRISKSAALEATTPPTSADLQNIILIPVHGDSPLDKQIAHAQEKVRSAADRAAALEQLGWLFVSKARVSFDPGFYKLADQCALAMQTGSSNSPEALLLRGHVLQSLHRFKEAEALARELVTIRGRSFDYGLLGDVLMEQGWLDESIVAYQKMADIKPDLHAYTRAAHVRWLKGDLAGAIEVMQLAVNASSPRDAESTAWVYARMGWYQWHAGRLEESLRYCDAAVELQTNYPPALLLRGRVFLSQEKAAAAIAPLELAAKLNPLPEYQWALADAFREAGRSVEANAVENQLKRTGAAADPRTFALYLATRVDDTATASRLAKDELETRADGYTQDAVAWSLAAADRWEEAGVPMQRALVEGIEDARLFLHAAIIAEHLNRHWDAAGYLKKATALQHTLLPSEKALLVMYSGLAAEASHHFSKEKLWESNKSQKPNQKGRS